MATAQPPSQPDFIDIVGGAQKSFEKPVVPVRAALPEKHKGTKTYRLRERYYRNGRLYEAGDTITLHDEAPGRTWELLEPLESAAPAAPQPIDGAPPAAPQKPSSPAPQASSGKSGRAADKDL